MERKTWSVHFGMENAEKPVQNNKKKRSQIDKIGRLKYNQQLLKQNAKDIKEIKMHLRSLRKALKPLFQYEKQEIQETACQDEVDREILQLLYEAGSASLLPKDLAFRLKHFKVTRHQISRRLQRMNKRLEKEHGERIAEKRGWHWALTSFIVEAWGETEKRRMKRSF